MDPPIKFTRGDGKWVSFKVMRKTEAFVTKLDLVSVLPNCYELKFEVYPPIKAVGTAIHEAHKTWTISGLHDAETPTGFPRQPDDSTVPKGTVKLAACCINNWTGGMGSQFGFIGTYVSFLILLDDETVWDVRSCEAY
ncbi:hypothetical protein N9Y42_02730 [Mariniblastus sp.]|nr:hypothetical protein [Mariniblastus sp.]